MKSKLSLKNSAKRGQCLSLIIFLCFICGCSFSTKPTYSREGIAKAIQDICKKEYKLDTKVTVAGSTLWIYLPVEDMISKSEKAEKYVERFEIDANKDEFIDGSLKLEYLIKNIPEKEKSQSYTYEKRASEKMNNVWKVLRRVLFSMDRSQEGNELKLFCLVTADIKNGFETRQIFYYQDLKKVSYGMISWNEYQHRTVDETYVSPKIIGDKDGLHLTYKDITLGEFIAGQIKHRINLKFQKPEVGKNADIDKEILKIVIYTIKTYNFRDFATAEFNNLLTQNRITLDRQEVSEWSIK